LEISANGSTSTCCLRQWAVQVRRRARPATSLHRVAARTPVCGSTTKGVGNRRRTALTLRARLPLAPRPRHCSRRVHPRQSGSRGHIDRALGKGILLTQFAQPQEGPCWTLQGPILLQAEGLSRYSASPSSCIAGPLPGAIRLLRVFCGRDERRTFFGGHPLDLAYLSSRHAHGQGRGAGSTPIDKRFATVLAHTRCRNTSGRDLLRYLHQRAPRSSAPRP
jgi:hypothetical protein